MRRAARTDSNHEEIVKALRAVGATVQSLAGVGHGVPDLLVGYQGKTSDTFGLFEIASALRD